MSELREKVDQYDDLPLIDELDSIIETVSFKTVGFIGERGTGKTSILNSFLGEKDFLPTGRYSHTTAAITEVCGWNRNYFSASIYFIDMDDWNNDLQDYLQVKLLTRSRINFERHWKTRT